MSNEPELITAPPDKWTVVTIYHKAARGSKELATVKHYELHFDHRCQDKRKGQHGYEVLKLTAKHLNRQNAVPRRPIMCAADSPNPHRYLAVLSGVRS